jgi:predicted phage tail protein
MCAIGSVLLLSRRAGRTGDTTVNEDLGERILRELQDNKRDVQETKSDVKTFALALNALNTEVARMSVKVEQLSNLQQTTAEHGQRLARIEAELANHDKNAERISGLYRWIIALGVTTAIAMIGLALQFFRLVRLP